MFINKFLTSKLEEAINSFLDTGYRADILLKNIFKKYRMGKRDRTWTRERFYFYLRNRYLVEFYAESKELLPETICRLYENEPDEFIKNRAIDLEKLSEAERRFIKASFPKWLSDKMADYSDLEWFNSRAITTIRVNTLKTDRSELTKLLLTEEIETQPTEISPLGLLVTKNESKLTKSKFFEEGLFDIQDESSQIVSALIPQAGQTVLDACAGGGGKSLSMASFFPSKKITATDIRTNVFKEIHLRSKRAGAKIKTSKVEELNGKLFDTVFIDAPCSGTGVLRRNPDDRWRLSEESVQSFVEMQKKCLNSYKTNLGEGGILIYVTCSFLKEENEEQIEDFLCNNKNLTLLNATNILKENIKNIDPETISDGNYIRISPGFNRDLLFAAVMRKDK